MPDTGADTKVLFAHRDARRQAARYAGCDRAALLMVIGGAASKSAAPGVLAYGRPAVFGRQPLQMLVGNFIQKTRTHGVPRLPMQHPALRQRQVQALARPRTPHVHQETLDRKSVG